MHHETPVDNPSSEEERIALARELRSQDLGEAAERIAAMEPARAVAVLELLNTATALDLLWELEAEPRARVVAAAPEALRSQWTLDRSFEEGTVGSLMEPALAVFRPSTTVADAIARLRTLVQRAFINYGFLTDDDGRLQGVFAFRELLFAEHGQTLGEISLRDPFTLQATTVLAEAMQAVVTRHFPAYPVCDAEGRLLGIVRGHVLFEAQAFEISAQAGKMQGVDREERVSTPWLRSLRFRHPWLQLNLLTAFIAAAVVGVFQDTLDRIIVLAAFLPVLAGQSGNTGCQALAVTLRGLTLGEMRGRSLGSLLGKEALLGLGNGLLIGIVAGTGMWYYAASQGSADALLLGAIVWGAMTLACLVSGVGGASIPLVLSRLGADPATASSIFLTTMTDVVSMGVFLGLATMLIS
jgi:magnesium transporter